MRSVAAAAQIERKGYGISELNCAKMLIVLSAVQTSRLSVGAV